MAALIIVGGSYAAVQIAAAARQNGWQGGIRILSEDRDPPYQRPPLSKGFLSSEVEQASLTLRAPAFYRESDVQLELGVRVESIDRRARSVLASGAGTLEYARLALATGARPRRLQIAGAELDGVQLLRSLADARAIKARLAAAESVAVIGGGFIGLEAAASCSKLGKQVSIIEARPRLMSRAVPSLVADWFADLHRRRGVGLHLRTAVSALKGDRRRVRAVALADGTEIPADVVIVGVGVVPNQELAASAGLACSDGLLVDRLARTSDPEIVAAGDCTRFPSAYAQVPIRLESVQNAQDQARTAGTTVAGGEAPYETVPWFWSDQHGAKVQMAGLSAGHDAYAVRGSMDEGRFSVYYLRGGRLIAVDSINAAADHMLARRLIAARVSLSTDEAADLSLDLRTRLPDPCGKGDSPDEGR